jgi:hypothetical protein
VAARRIGNTALRLFGLNIFHASDVTAAEAGVKTMNCP